MVRSVPLFIGIVTLLAGLALGLQTTGAQNTIVASVDLDSYRLCLLTARGTKDDAHIFAYRSFFDDIRSAHEQHKLHQRAAITEIADDKQMRRSLQDADKNLATRRKLAEKNRSVQISAADKNYTTGIRQCETLKPKCSNKICEANERANCPKDCPVCGDGVCTSNEKVKICTSCAPGTPVNLCTCHAVCQADCPNV